jgi:hypothetical protein
VTPINLTQAPVIRLRSKHQAPRPRGGKFTPTRLVSRAQRLSGLGTLPIVDWSPIWSAAVAAGIVSAVANGLFALWRHAVEAKTRRHESEHGHLRDAAAEFLAAEAAAFRHSRHARDAVEEFIAHRQGFPGDKAGIEERNRQRLEALRERADADAQARNAIGRMRLYSESMHKLAEALLVVRHGPRPADVDDRVAEHHERALQAFVKAAQAELRVRKKLPAYQRKSQGEDHLPSAARRD